MLEKPLLKVLAGDVCSPSPLWLMRQAGRYLPEYRALRQTAGGFLELLFDPERAAEVTLQPIHRFGFDAAILFSDILVVPLAMGQSLRFDAGEGPQLAPALTVGEIGQLIPNSDVLRPIYETVRRVKAALPATTSLIGFAGSPWTVATYMVAGQGSKDQAAARVLAYQHPARFEVLLQAIEHVTLDYLSGQVAAGVEVVQLFDSWAGVLPPAEFARWVTAPNARLVAALRARHPEVRIICFPRGAGQQAASFAQHVQPDALGLDEQTDLAKLLPLLPKSMVVQGNIDPLALLAGGDALINAIDRCRAALAGHPHILNLGHGILQQTPVAHVEALVARVREVCQ